MSDFRLRRVTPGMDLAERLGPRRALALAAVEAVGLAVLMLLYGALHAQQSVLAPLLVPPVVSFVLVIASPGAVGSRPARILVSYVIAGFFGLGVAALSLPVSVGAVVAGALALLAMHLTGALHSPAIAVALIAVFADFSTGDALHALPLLIGLAGVVVVLAWLAHGVIGDTAYPDRYW